MNNLNQARLTLPHSWLGFVQLGEPTSETRKQEGRVTEVTMYRCNHCDELHDWEEDAEECCAKDLPPGAGDPNCPVCNCEFSDNREASDCCLWKDLDAPTRWAMADAVDEGSTWTEQLQTFIARKAHQ